MSCKPHPSIPNWGTKQPSQCPALWVSQSPLQPRGQRGSRAFLLNQTGKHNPSLLFSANFIGKDPFSSCPSKFPDAQMHRQWGLSQWFCPRAQRPSRHRPGHGMWLVGLTDTETRLRQCWKEALSWVLGPIHDFAYSEKSIFHYFPQSQTPWKVDSHSNISF